MQVVYFLGVDVGVELILFLFVMFFFFSESVEFDSEVVVQGVAQMLVFEHFDLAVALPIHFGVLVHTFCEALLEAESVVGYLGNFEFFDRYFFGG